MNEENKKMKTHYIMNDEQSMQSVPAYIPSQMLSAYDFPEDCQGQGITIAIVDAFGSPTIREDVAVFNERFGLPPIILDIAFPDGPPDPIGGDLGWIIETTLDVEWAHALAPRARILLVVAKNAEVESIFSAIQFAATSGANVVSMSFGTAEFEELREFDPIFNQPGVVFVASTGDSSNVSYPATNPRVIAAGGTSLQLNPCGERLAPEITWYETGGGISTIEEKPPWQFIPSNAVPKTSMRTTPDLAFYADPFPGVAIYYTLQGQSTWASVGGTSVSAPCLSAIFADSIPEGQRIDNAPRTVYEIFGCNLIGNPNVFRDIKNGNNLFYQALPGYDYTTGLGTLFVREFIRSIRKSIMGC